MPWFVTVLAFSLVISAVYFELDQVHVSHATTNRAWSAQLDSALQHGITDAKSALVAAAQASGGQVLTLPSDSTTQTGVCAFTDQANLQESDCANLVVQTLHFDGFTTAASTGAPEAVANINTAPGTNNETFENVVAFDLTEKLTSSDGSTTIAQRTASGTLRVIDACDNAQACANGTADPQVVFDGWRDATGSHDIAAAGRGGGKCPTTDPTCSGLGRDASAATAAQSDDSRVHRNILCFDPTFHGNGGTHQGDLCNPTGNPNAAPVGSDTYSDGSLTNAATSAGNFAR